MANARRLRLTAAFFTLLLAACHRNTLNQGSAPPDAGPPVPDRCWTTQTFDAPTVRKIDFLFMIDNTDSMAEKQQALGRDFPLVIKALTRGKSGLPDIHIAFISSDVGAGPTTIGPRCVPLGDRGRFQVRPGCGLNPGSNYLSVQANGTKSNFTGTLEDVFSCMAKLGVDGCGYKHPLQSIRAALADVNPENAGFLRPDALLAIVILTDEDDCSAAATSDLFAPEISGESRNFRCAREGHLCNGTPVTAMDATVPINRCAARTDPASRLIQVEEIANFVKSLKGVRMDRIFVAGIIGSPTEDTATYKVMHAPQGTEAVLDSICSSANGTAGPALRIKKFIESFEPEDRAIQSICSNDLTTPIRNIGGLFVNHSDPWCIGGPLFDTDEGTPGIQPDCQVSDDLPQGNGSRKQPVPSCTVSGGAKPCWKLRSAPECPTSGVIFELDRASDAFPPAGTIVSIRCQTSTLVGDPTCRH